MFFFANLQCRLTQLWLIHTFPEPPLISCKAPKIHNSDAPTPHPPTRPQKRHDLLRTAVRAAPPEGYPLGPPGCAIRGRVAALLPGQPLLPPCADSDGGASAGGGGGGGGAANAAAATSAGGGGGGYHRDLDASDPGSRILSRVGTNKELIQEMYDLALANNVRQGGSGTDVQALVGV
jgi:hypothetical protein